MRPSATKDVAPIPSATQSRAPIPSAKEDVPPIIIDVDEPKTVNDGPMDVDVGPMNIDTGPIDPPPPPSVTLHPPTPKTSQEAATSVPTTLLQVPEIIPSSQQLDSGTDQDEGTVALVPYTPSRSSSVEPRRSSRLRSRSPTPAPSSTVEPRRSSRLGSKSPTPSPSSIPTKRPSESSGEEPIAKKSRV